MTNKIIHKKSAVAGKRPSLADIEPGEIAINTRDAVVIFKSSDGSVERLESLAPERLTISGSAAGVVSSTEHLAGVVASQESSATGIDAVVIGSRGSKASGNISAVIASGAATADGSDTNSRAENTRSAVIAGYLSKTTGVQSAVLASGSCETAGSLNNAIIASQASKTAHQRALVVASLGVLSGAEGTLVGGWTGATGTIVPSSANRRWELNSVTGNAKLAGTLTASAGFADIGEYYENGTGSEIPMGTIVTLDGHTVRPAVDGEPILGVVSATAAAALNDTPFSWAGRYMRGEFGEIMYAPVAHVRWTDEEGGYDGPVSGIVSIRDGAVFYTLDLPVENPDFDPSLDQIPRSERPSEWTLVGLIGQVYVRVTDYVAPGDWIRATTTPGRGGKSTTKTSLRCMKITSPFEAERGYAVALCGLKGGF